MVLEKKILKLRQCFFAISLLSLLVKGRGPSFEQNWISFTQECFVPSLVEMWPSGCGEKMIMWKVYGQKDRLTTDDRRSKKFTEAFSSGELNKINEGFQTLYHAITENYALSNNSHSLVMSFTLLCSSLAPVAVLRWHWYYFPSNPSPITYIYHFR